MVTGAATKRLTLDGLRDRRVVRLLVTVLLAAVAATAAPIATAQSAAGNWRDITPAEGPGERMDPAIAYDHVREMTVMFGGSNRTTNVFSNETWLFDGASWHLQDPAARPPARGGAGMAFFPTSVGSGESVLFGQGASAGGPGETWIWNGETWAHKLTVPAPPTRQYPAMVYDEARENIVLFGGQAGATLNDTWIYNGVQWTLMTTHPSSTPPARHQAAMGFDRNTGKVILFGGWSLLNGSALGDTWSWDGTQWTREFPVHSPEPVGAAEIAWDGSELVLFGGASGDAGVNTQVRRETWTWNGTDWVDQDPLRTLNPKPPGRFRFGMVYDSVRGETVLFEGAAAGLFSDTWRWRRGEDFSPVSSIVVTDAAVEEGDAGTTDLVFTLVMEKPAESPVTATYETVAGSATEGVDFTPLASSVTFAPDETEKPVVVTVNGDTTGEVDETLYLKLVSAEGAEVGAVRGRGTIVNDDGEPSGPALTVGDASVEEGVSGQRTISFPVSLSPASTGPVSVEYYTLDGSAVAPDDYQAATGSINFAAGEQSKTIGITVNGDIENETSEKFFVYLSNPSNAHVFDEVGEGTIINSDPNEEFEPGPGGGGGSKADCAPIDHDFFAYASSFTGGVYTAVGDFDGDGCDEVATGAGQGGGPHVRLFRGDGVLLAQFFAYNTSFSGGVRVAAGDVDGDKKDELITAAGPGGGPHVRVFDLTKSRAFAERYGFFPYHPSFTGGLFVAAGDLTAASPNAEVITGAGEGGGPHVRIFRGSGGALGGLFAYNTSFSGGVRVAAGDVDGDKRDELITGPGPGGGPHVRVLDVAGSGGFAERYGFFAYHPSFTGGVFVAAGNVTGAAPNAEVITGAGEGGGPHVRIFRGSGGGLSSFFAYHSSFTGGVRVAAGNVDGKSAGEIVTGPGPGGGPHVRIT
jgi:hypothetical protein